QLRDRWAALAPRGDLRAVDLEVNRAAGAAAAPLDYRISAEFAGLGANALEGLPGADSLTGAVRADSRSGRVELKSNGATFDWPAVFRTQFDVAELNGIVVWRQGQDAVRIVSDDLVLATADASTRSNLELTLPSDGGSPRLDLATSVSGFELAAAR